MPFINEQPVQSEVNDQLEHELVLAAWKIQFSNVSSLKVTKSDFTIRFSLDLMEKGLVVDFYLGFVPFSGVEIEKLGAFQLILQAPRFKYVFLLRWPSRCVL